MKKITIKVLECKGTIDETATQANFLAALAELKAESIGNTEQIAHAVNAVFDSCEEGTRLNLPHLAAMAVAKMNVAPKSYGSHEAQVLAYIRSNSKGEDALFNIGRGFKQGGVARTGITLDSSELEERQAAE